MALFRGLGFSHHEELHSCLLFPRRAAGSRTAELAHCAPLCPLCPLPGGTRRTALSGAGTRHPRKPLPALGVFLPAPGPAVQLAGSARICGLAGEMLDVKDL